MRQSEWLECGGLHVGRDRPSDADSSPREKVITAGKVYFPKVGDVIIGEVVKKNMSMEAFILNINASSEAVLPFTEFAGGSRRNCPKLEAGDPVLCLVSSAPADVLVTCKCKNDRKSWSTGEAYLGPLSRPTRVVCEEPAAQSGWVLHDLPLVVADRLLAADSFLLDRTGNAIPYEIAVGTNGIAWVRAATVRATLFVGNCVLRGARLESDAMVEVMIRMLSQLFDVKDQSR